MYRPKGSNRPTTTYHADYRARKRLGVPDITKQFGEALKHGAKRADLKGQLATFINSQLYKYPKNRTCTIYKNMIYWHTYSNVLITVFPLHQKYHKYLKSKEKKC